ncbi:MAG: hypothetical protein Q6373_025180 [Candidatus Sigynarchaeota archaeon]
MEPGELRAYSRGMMVRPAWQGYRGISRLFGVAFQHLLQQYDGQLRIVWGEARSASVKPQAVAESIGMKPVGILPGKDLFFGKRETAIIVAVYSTRAWTSRDTNISLVARLKPIYQHVRNLFNPMSKDCLEIREPPSFLSSIKNDMIDVFYSKGAYGYTNYTFSCQTTGSFLRLTVNEQCLNAEHMEMQCPEAGEAVALLNFAIEHLRKKKIQFIEGKCPVNNLGLQRAFISAGMHPLGYLPAWSKDPVSGLNVDHVVFGWGDLSIDPNSTKLSSTATALARACFFE